jgi:hypothetical protein
MRLLLRVFAVPGYRAEVDGRLGAQSIVVDRTERGRPLDLAMPAFRAVVKLQAAEIQETFVAPHGVSFVTAYVPLANAWTGDVGSVLG